MVKANERGTQPYSSWQLMMLPQPHGITLTPSRMDLITIEMKVSKATQRPTKPILLAMIASFFWRSVSSSVTELSERAPAGVFSPTAITIPVPVPA
jgi:hypothetical protein